MRPKTALPVSHSEAPGPGTYTLDSLVGRSAPAASMSGRFHLSQDSFQPGPGAYNLQQVGEIGKDAPHISMAQRPKASSQQAGTPGPGQYTVYLPSDTPAITMQGRHEEAVDDWKVGPGTYTIPSPRDGPEFTMAARFNGSSSLYAATTNPMHFFRDHHMKTTTDRPSAYQSEHKEREPQWAHSRAGGEVREAADATEWRRCEGEAGAGETQLAAQYPGEERPAPHTR